MEGIKITNGGRLLRTRWVYDENKDEGRYVADDVSDIAPGFLFAPCTLEEGVALKDIFKLLERDIDLYKIVIGNWVDEIVAEGLQPFSGEETELDHLELYWDIDYSEEEEGFSGNILPKFHGIGIVDDIPYSLMFTPANEIAELPLKLSQELTISNTAATESEISRYKGPDFSLGQILYGIIWELSWSGSPEERDRKRQELLEARDQISSSINEF